MSPFLPPAPRFIRPDCKIEIHCWLVGLIEFKELIQTVNTAEDYDA